MPDRQTLTQISPRAWEHPADRAALNTLRSLPGFDEVLRKALSVLGERGIRQLFLANAVKVGPTQRPALDAMYAEVLATLDAPMRYELYVAQHYEANAFCIGFDKPFIVVNSQMIELLEPEERRAVLAHEVGHAMSGHATYTTLALLFLLVGTRFLPWLAGIAILPVELALFEWYRKAEFSADRAALLGSQDPRAAMSLFLKLAGGLRYDDQIDHDAFLVQAAEYETQGDITDNVWKILNTAFRTHPFATVRAAELQRWIASGEYDRILRGEYMRRGQEPRPLGDDYADAGDYYRRQAKSAVDAVNDVINRAREAFNDRRTRGE
ncbi:MAG: M48 family metallopeptidase [Gemmatimonadaceae bacterium]|nr:M48 family metallopeptidase [Gemmatimonadaceae bacterium]